MSFGGIHRERGCSWEHRSGAGMEWTCEGNPKSLSGGE